MSYHNDTYAIQGTSKQYTSWGSSECGSTAGRNTISDTCVSYRCIDDAFCDASSGYCGNAEYVEKTILYKHGIVMLDFLREPWYSESYISKSNGKQELSMSLAGVISCCDGAVIFADTRNTVVDPDGGTTFLDNEHKFIQVPDTNTFLIHTGRNRFQNGSMTIFDLSDQLKGMSDLEMSGEILRLYSLEESGDFRTLLVTKQYEKNIVRLRCISLTRDENGDITRHISFLQGKGYIYQGVPWGIKLLEETYVSAATMEETAIRVREFIKGLYDVLSILPNQKRTVGPDVDIAKIKYFDERTIDIVSAVHDK